MTPPTILIIEDETSLVDVLAYNLRKEGFQVLVATDGLVGLESAQSKRPDLIILDLMLPTLDGLQICQRLKADPTTAPIRILMLTAKSDEVDEIVGFNLGADDYVTKPFKLKPLIHRIKALLRRPAPEAEASQRVAYGGIEMDRISYTVTVDDRELELTPTEFRLLWTLLRRPGRTYTRSELLDASRGEDANAFERTIDVHIRALRRKLGPRSDLIETVRGIGYRVRMRSQPTENADT
ncbi:MAG: response regulator [Planctomycetes bacterium]|nr:response regulator [Planctomycetota bacterium]